jgi:Fic family protein
MQLFSEAEQRGPDKEVLHYRDALLAGFESMSHVPLSARTIHLVHATLLPEDVDGFRKQQNSIAEGADGRPRYTPPPAPAVPDLISNWQHYVHDDDEVDPLVKCAIQHYQFEAIHPFPDGNGRTGRILMVLHLVHVGLLELPVLYISGFINKHRARYYELLREVSSNGAWNEWILFMLDALSAQAAETKQTALAILQLFESMRDRIRREHPRIYSAELVEQLFSYPVATPVNLARQLGIHYTTATRYLKALTDAGLLTDAEVGKYHLYANHKLLEIVRE